MQFVFASEVILHRRCYNQREKIVYNPNHHCDGVIIIIAEKSHAPEVDIVLARREKSH